MRRTQAEAMESRIASKNCWTASLLDGEFGFDHHEKTSLDEIASARSPSDVDSKSPKSRKIFPSRMGCHCRSPY